MKFIYLFRAAANLRRAGKEWQSWLRTFTVNGIAALAGFVLAFVLTFVIARKPRRLSKIK